MSINPNAFTGNPLDRASDRRKDEAWLSAQMQHDEAMLILFWRGKPLIARHGEDGRAAPVWLSQTARRDVPGDAPTIFLGLWADRPVIAIDVTTKHEDPADAPFADFGQYRSLRDCGDLLAPEDLAVLGHAAWVLDWHRRHQFCPRTGKPTRMIEGGTKRLEPDTGTEHYVRVDPVAIILPIYDGHCLLGRSPHFPRNMFSAIAGYVDPGETLEECAIRETWEEVGVTIRNVRYVFSQPWPFPSSLMMAVIGDADGPEIILDPEEIEAARWVEKAEVAALLQGERREDIWLPPPYAIATQLMKHWVNN